MTAQELFTHTATVGFSTLAVLLVIVGSLALVQRIQTERNMRKHFKKRGYNYDNYKKFIK